MSLKIVFFIFAALAGLALNWFAFTCREEADNRSRNRNRESGFHGPYGFLNASYVNVLGRKEKYASPTTPKRSTNPAHEENAKAIADGQRDGEAFATTTSAPSLRLV